jgi:hypothetical protein
LWQTSGLENEPRAAHIHGMNQHVFETSEQDRERLRFIAQQYGLGTANVDVLSVEEVREALRQFDAGLLPERLTACQ